MIGNDIDPAMRDQAAQRCSGLANVTITGGDWTGLDGQFDVVTMVAALHHLEVAEALRDVRSRRPGTQAWMTASNGQAATERASGSAAAVSSTEVSS